MAGIERNTKEEKDTEVDIPESGSKAWKRVTTREEFCRLFADRELSQGDLSFTIHSDGKLTGYVDGLALSGTWAWEEGYFCRRAYLAEEDLGTDCELIESDGHRMRYFPDKGKGSARIVS